MPNVLCVKINIVFEFTLIGVGLKFLVSKAPKPTGNRRGLKQIVHIYSVLNLNAITELIRTARRLFSGSARMLSAQLGL